MPTTSVPVVRGLTETVTFRATLGEPDDTVKIATQDGLVLLSLQGYCSEIEMQKSAF